MARLDIIQDPVTKNMYARDLDVPGSTYAPYTPPPQPKTSPIASTTPTTSGTTSGTTLGTTLGTTSDGIGVSASFLTQGVQSILANLNDIQAQMPTATETEAAINQERDLSRREIQQRFAEARSDIEEQKEAGMNEIERTRESLGLTPAVLGNKIREFNESTDNFFSKISKSIENLTQEEELALEKNDLDYANQIRQAKIDYINTQRQLMQDKFNTLTNFYNIMLTGQQIQRQEKIDAQTDASNKLNTILQTYGGKGISFDTLPTETKSAIEDSASVLGIPLDVIKDQMAMVQRDLQIVREGDYTSIYDKSTGSRIQRYYAPSSNTSSSIDFESFIRGNVSEKDAMKNPDNRQKLMLLQNDALGGLIWNGRKNMEADISRNTKNPPTPQSLMIRREMLIDSITDELAAHPLDVSKYLGINYSIFSLTKDSPEYNSLRDFVKERVEELIPDSWIYNKVAAAQNPLLWAFEQMPTEFEQQQEQEVQPQGEDIDSMSR